MPSWPQKLLVPFVMLHSLQGLPVIAVVVVAAVVVVVVVAASTVLSPPFSSTQTYAPPPTSPSNPSTVVQTLHPKPRSLHSVWDSHASINVRMPSRPQKLFVSFVILHSLQGLSAITFLLLWSLPLPLPKVICNAASSASLVFTVGKATDKVTTATSAMTPAMRRLVHLDEDDDECRVSTSSSSSLGAVTKSFFVVITFSSSATTATATDGSLDIGESFIVCPNL